jgi:hypothetical protein
MAGPSDNVRNHICNWAIGWGLQFTKNHIISITWIPLTSRGSRIKWEIQMGGPPDNISLASVKTPETGLNTFEQKNGAIVIGITVITFIT